MSLLPNTVSPKTCPECGYIEHPKSECSFCGKEYKIKERNGSLFIYYSGYACDSYERKACGECLDKMIDAVTEGDGR
jgi:primosomal protein N'